MLETRWAAAEKIFEENGIEAVDYFTGADPAEIKKIISDELAKGDVQGIWMDAGDGARRGHRGLRGRRRRPTRS